jgi:hypothetical protein
LPYLLHSSRMSSTISEKKKDIYWLENMRLFL